MAIEQFERLQADDQVLNRVQDNIARVLDEYTSNARRPGNNYEILEDVTITTGSTQDIAHKLGRTVRGFRITKINAAATVHWDTASTADLAKFIPLVSSATVIVNLELF